MQLPERTPKLLELEDYLLLTAVLLLPWAFGGIDVSAYRTASLLLVGAACTAFWKRGWRGWGLGSGELWLLPAFLLVGWAASQIVPLPPGAVRVLSPEAHRIYASVFPGYDGGDSGDPLRALEAQALNRVPEARGVALVEDPGTELVLQAPDCFSRSWRTLSLEPGATQERLLWYLALLLGFLVLRARLAFQDVRRVYRWGLFLSFGALALFGLVQRQWWTGEIYWVRTVLVPVFPFGPYFNPTHFGGAMELAVPALVGHAWARLRYAGRAALYQPGFGISAVAGVVCLVAGLATASKLVAIMLPAGLIVLGIFGARTRRTRVVILAVSLFVLAAVVLLLFSPSTPVGQRFEEYAGRSEGALLEGRLIVWRASLDMIGDFPLTGAGFGSFRHIFARYMPAGESMRWAHAHNDYLELLLDGGVVALGLLGWLVWGYGTRVARRLHGAAPVSPGRIGLVVGLVTLSIHAFLDFNHQIPANALLFVATCALLLPARRVHDPEGTT